MLAPEYHPKAFNNWGIFYPVILQNGKIAGNWNKSTRKKEMDVVYTYFEGYMRDNANLLQKAVERYKAFYTCQ